jgi:uncharacterized small protein (DUF1192 family)
MSINNILEDQVARTKEQPEKAKEGKMASNSAFST